MTDATANQPDEHGRAPDPLDAAPEPTPDPPAGAQPDAPPEMMREVVRIARRDLEIRLTPLQRQAIDAVVAGRDTLLVSPTGSGKSAVYQLAGAVLDGASVVVSPLISLQDDQLAGLEASGIGPAVVVNAARGAAARRSALARITSGEAEFVLLGPEQLLNADVLEALRQRTIDRFIVDEAHCVDSWGPDFRPQFLALGAVRRALGAPPALALTATAAPYVRDEIAAVLGLRDPEVLVGDIERRNIHIAVARHADRGELESALVEAAIEAEGTGLIYVGRRQDATRLASALVDRGRTAAAYHGSLPLREREAVHERFRSGEPIVVVATSAFGLGIDAPNVRFVLHAETPETIDAYYQEIGRGGRDGEPATAVVHTTMGASSPRAFAAGASVPTPELCAAVAEVVRGAGDVPLDELRRHLRQSTGRTMQAVRVLDTAGVVRFEGAMRVGAGEVPWADAAPEVTEHLDRRRELLASRRHMMRAFVEADACRWAAIGGYLGGTEIVACGHCDVCGARGDGRRRGEGTRPVRHEVFGEGVVVSEDASTLTVLFDEHGYRTLSRELVDEEGLLAAI